MRTIDQVRIRSSLARVFQAAAEVERWPDILPHYRWVRLLERRPGGGGLVEMAAWRPFGPVRYPTWWVSEMTIDPASAEIRYRHVRGITSGMNVVWRIAALADDGATAEGEPGRLIAVRVEHTWRGPAWPLVGRFAASWVIGPVFIHGVASRTLAGIKRYTEELS